MSPMSSNMWAIEYSHSRDAFHLGRTAEMIRRNQIAFQTGAESDFICVGIYATQEKAKDAMLEFRRKRFSSNTLALF